MLFLMAFHNLVPLLVMNQVLLTIPFGIMIWYLAYEQGWAAKVLNWKPLVLLGEASYSLYMLHIGMFFVLNLAFKKVFHFDRFTAHAVIGSVPGSVVSMTCMIPLVFLGSIVAFKFIETPARRWVVKQFSGASPAVRKSVELAAGGAISERTAEEDLGLRP
jgi:peptidoglycan/LPS O-acetylase OafA/YrhL